ncbi:MAG TPA: xanthine dehydrogenase family protein subunit M [Actinomycetota bacterium]|nr:xanthine dehydrogenase family protein subunit M [Actinomycetota bacterium]
MIPAPFEYEVASSVENAIELLAAGGEGAKLLAGGHSLIPLMKLRFARPTLLIDIARVGSLSYIRDGGDHIAVGACTRHGDVHRDELLAEANPMLAYVAGLIGDPQVRHKGTIGGSVAHGDPASDLPAALVALDATLVAQGPGGTRTIGAGDFFAGIFTTALSPDEILTEVRVPRLDASTGWSYIKFNRRAQDWAIVSAAAVVHRSNGAAESARVALGNMGTAPVRATGTEEAITGAGRDAIAAAAARAAEGTNPPADTNAGPDYRRHLAQVLTGRALQGAFGS